jgi:predicted transcriptional regulator
MTGRSTITVTIRISPELWARLGLICNRDTQTRNGAVVNMIRERVVRERSAWEAQP